MGKVSKNRKGFGNETSFLFGVKMKKQGVRDRKKKSTLKGFREDADVAVGAEDGQTLSPKKKKR